MLVEHQQPLLRRRRLGLVLEAERQLAAVAAEQPHRQRDDEGLARVRRGRGRGRLLEAEGEGARRRVVAATRGQARRAGLTVPALELEQAPGQLAARVGVGDRLGEVVAGDGLAVVALEVESDAALEAGASDQRLHHAHDLGALLVDRRRVEVVDLDVAVRPHRVRHRARVLGELHLAQVAHRFDPAHRARGRARHHVHAELLVAEDREALLQAQLEPVAAGDAVAGPVVEVLVADHRLDRHVVVVGRRRRIGEHVLGVEEVEPLVLHRPHVEVADGDDHEALEVERQAEARLVPDHRGHQRFHRPFGLVEVALAHPDLQQVVLARARADPLLARHQAGRDQGEQVARLRERVVPAGEVAAVLELAFLDQVAIGEQDRVGRLVGADQHRVLGHHVGPVEEEGDAAEALGLALGEEAAARGVEAGECGVLLRRAGVADLEAEAAFGRVVDDEHAVLVAERHRFAVGQAPGEDQLLAVQAQRSGGHVAVALDLHPAGDQRLRRVEVEGQVDLPDPERRRRVLVAADQGGGAFAHGGVPRLQFVLVLATPCFRLASMKASRSPSSTFWVLLISTLVRRSLIRLWSST